MRSVPCTWCRYVAQKRIRLESAGSSTYASSAWRACLRVSSSSCLTQLSVVKSRSCSSLMEFVPARSARSLVCERLRPADALQRRMIEAQHFAGAEHEQSARLQQLGQRLEQDDPALAREIDQDVLAEDEVEALQRRARDVHQVELHEADALPQRFDDVERVARVGLAVLASVRLGDLLELRERV